MVNKTISANYLLSLIRHLEQVGHSEAIVEEALGTDLAELENAAASGHPIPEQLYGRFYRFYLQTMAGENFGFPSNIGDMGGRYKMLYTMMVNSDTLGKALNKLQQFIETFAVDNQLIKVVDIDDRRVACEFQFLMAASHRRGPQEAIIIANLVAGLHRVLCWLSGLPVPIQRVDITGRTPEHPERYQQLFDCPVHFGAAQTCIEMQREVLDYGVVQTEASLQDFLEHFPEPLFERPDQQQENITDRVNTLIGHKLKRNLPSLAEIAKLLNMSESGLKQALKKEGHSYSQLIEAARKQQAIELLTDSSLDLNTIAKTLGFPATSAFHRSFKRWTGSTPGEYRKQHNPQD